MFLLVEDKGILWVLPRKVKVKSSHLQGSSSRNKKVKAAKDHGKKFPSELAVSISITVGCLDQAS